MEGIPEMIAMMTIDAALLATLPGLPVDTRGKLAADLSRYQGGYGLHTPLRMAHFLAQCAHESQGFTRLVENLNYSANGLKATWPSRFDNATAEAFARNPEQTANKVYASRLGNGDQSSGDGWRYRGRGLIQVTGKDNYRKCGDALGLDLVKHPEFLETIGPAIASALWFWSVRQLNAKADNDDIEGITRAINGGLNGLEDRKAWLAKFRRALA